MIYNPVDEGGNVKIKFGDLTTLVVSGHPTNPAFEDVIYLGLTPESELTQRSILKGEGNYLFANLNREKALTFYVASSLKMNYWSDGCEDPSYPVGIYAYKSSSILLRNSELDYVRSLIDKRETEKRSKNVSSRV